MTVRVWAVRALACALVSWVPTPRASAGVIRVAPSGGDDTAALQAALAACVPGGADCVVQLAAGTYRTRQLYASGFHGAVRGAGMDATAVVALTPYVGIVDPYAAEPDPTTNPQPHIVSLYGGSDVLVADLSFRVDDADPAEPYLYGGCPVRGLKAAVFVSGSAWFDQVAFQGLSASTVWQVFDGEQCVDLVTASLDNGPMLSSSAPGETFGITASRFRRMGNGFELYGILGADVTVGGSPQAGNTFEQGSNAGVFLVVDASHVLYSFNRSTGSDATAWNVLLIQNSGYPFTAPTSFVVDHNTFSGSGALMNGVAVVDRPGNLARPKSVELVFTNNVVDVHDPAFGWGMYLAGLDAPLVASNRFTGEGDIGIVLDATRNAPGSTGGLLQANDLNRLRATEASIVLFPRAHDVTVLGGGHLAAVWDFGSEDVLVGVNNMGTGVGPSVRSALETGRALRIR